MHSKNIKKVRKEVIEAAGRVDRRAGQGDENLDSFVGFVQFFLAKCL